MYRQISIWKRVIYSILAIIMVLTSCNWGIILSAAAAVGNSGTFQVSFGTVTSGGVTMVPETNDGVGSFYMISKQQQTLLTANLVPNFSTGSVRGQNLEITLPYLYWDDSGVLAQVNQWEEIPTAKRDAGEYIGIEAKLNDKSTFGNSTTVFDANGTVLENNSYARGKIVLNNMYEPLSENCTPKFDIEFYTASSAVSVPENAAVTLEMKFSYTGLYDANNTIIGNAWSTDELDSSTKTQRTVTFVNSNLEWSTTIESVPTVQLDEASTDKNNAVMWQKYNYMVYEVTVQNDSKELDSTIDNYLITLQAQYNADKMRSILDDDILCWEKENPDTQNKNFSSDFYQHHEFIGKPNEGGVLVYDVTDTPDWKTQWDLEHFTNLPGETLSYGYSGTGTIILQKEAPDKSHVLYSEEKAAELNQSDPNEKHYSTRKYMVAIPYPNNFNSNTGFENTSGLTTTISFGGGSSIHWSKQDSNTTSFTSHTWDNFTHHKYVKDADGNEATDKTVGIGAVDEYYLDGFSSIGNIPVFNAVSTDHVPEDFGLQEIQICLQNDPVHYPDVQLKDWFKTDGTDINQFIQFGFTDENGDVIYKTAGELGLNLKQDVNAENADEKNWTLAIGDALTSQTGLTFCNEVQFLFREEIPRYTAFHGLITMRGAFPHLWTYDNKIDTSYEIHFYQPPTASEDGEGKWVIEPKEVTQANAVIRTEQAKPALTGIGVYDDSIGDLVQKGNPQTVSLNDDTAAARFVISNDSISEISPATLDITGLYPDEDYTAGGLVASKILLSKNLLQQAEIEKIVLHGKVNDRGTLTDFDIMLNDMEGYGTDADGNVVIPKSAWSKLAYFTGMTVYFKRISDSIPLGDAADDGNCYVQIHGTPTTERDITPHGVLKTAYSFGDHDQTDLDQTVEDTVTLNVSKVLPKLTASVHAIRKNGTEASSVQSIGYDRNGNAYPIYPKLAVPNRSETEQTWYQFLLTNNSRSTSSHALLQVNMDSVSNEPSDCLQDIEGFDTRKIVLDGIGAGRAAEIEKIELFDWDNTTYAADTMANITPDLTVTSDALTVDGNGNVTYEVPDTIRRLRSVRIIFSRIYGNTDLDHLKEMNLKLYGSTDWVGDLKASARFEVIGSINEASRTSSEATMQVAKTNLIITPSANRPETKETSNKSLTVPNKADNLYYGFLLENGAASDCYSKAGKSLISVDLQSVGVKTEKGGAKIIKGYLSDKVTISSNYAKSGEIESIKLTAFLPDGVSGPAQVKIVSLEELEKSKNSAGELEVDLSDWKERGLYLSNIEITYNDLERDLSAEQGNAPELRIYGTSEWFDDLTAKMTVTPQHELMQDQAKSASVAFHVDRPGLSVNTHIYYNDQKESTRAASGNTDGNETIFGVPYDRDFMLRAEFANETISVLDDTQIIAKVPYEKQGEAQTGFHTTELRIYQDLIDQFGKFDNIVLTGKDADDQEKTVTLLPKTDESGKIVGFCTEDAPETVYTYTNGVLTFTRDTDTRLFTEFGIENLTQVELNGRLVKLVDKSASEKRYIEFDGYDDSLFGKTDTLEVDTHNYLDGFRESKGYITEAYDKDKYIVTKKDTTAIYVSKMYFDTTVMAFYKDASAGDKKYTAAASAVEHLRKKYAQPTENMTTCSWRSDKHIHGADGYLFSEKEKWGDSADNSELEIGYKSIGSFAVDFRQYLNTGNNLPKAKPTLAGQEHQSYDYVRNASLNTAATVNITLDLPSNTFDAYYLKIDPRAKDYVQSVTAIYADGTKRTRSGQEILYEANESNADGSFARLNLLGSDADMFSADDANYYKKPESYNGKKPENPVTQVVVTIDINRYQTVNNDGKTAKSPDYGTWYDQTNSSTQGMFEVTGRFYRMDEAIATAHADVTVGNTTDGRSMVRTDSGAKKEKSEWSFTDQYYAWTNHHDYYCGHYWTYEIFDYTAKHLQSSTRVHIVNDEDNVQKGVGETPGTAENRNAEFGKDNSFAIRFYRKGNTKESTIPTSCVNPTWDGVGRVAPNNDVYHWTMNSPYSRTDQYDWVNKLSFTDKVVLSDSLPQIRPDDDYEYKGFLTTGIQIKKEIYQYFQDDDNIIFTLNAKNTKNEVVRTAKTISVPVAELKQLYGETEDWNIYFEYTPKQQDNTDNGDNAGGSTEGNADDADTGANQPQIEPTYTVKQDGGKYVVALGEDTFVTDYSMTMYNIPGTGDYSAELTDKEKADYHNTNTWDILVQGKPYAINKTDDDIYGKNTAQTSVSTDYAPDKEIYKQSDNAIIMGYLIDFKAGYALQTKSGVLSEKLYYDYDQTDNNTPNRGLFQVKLFNQDKQNATGQEAAARIDSAATTNTMDSRYRLEHIYLPTFLLDGDWFGVANLTLRVGSTDVPVRVVKGIGVDGMAEGTYVVHVDAAETVQGEEVYAVDVEQILRQLYQADSSALESYTNSTNQKVYVKAYVSSFQLDLKAVNPNRNNSDTVLGDGEYLSADKTKDKNAFLYDGVYVDRTPDDFTKDAWNSDSSPSFGKSPNGYPEQTTKNQLSAIFTSIDPNANTYIYKNTDNTAKGSKKEAAYTVKNLTGTLDAVVTRTRMYDQDSKTGKIDKVDYLHLMPYDYVEYTIQVGAPSSALIPLEHTTVDFSVPKGQRIVRWDVVDADGNVLTTEDAAENIPAADIHAALSDGGATIEAEQGIKYALLTASDADPEETAYQRLVAELGKGAKSDDQIKPGETVYLRVTTQLTENGGSYDAVTVGTPDLKIHAAPKHSYPQYSIYDTSNNANYTPSTDRRYYNKRTQDAAGYAYYYRYTAADADKQTQYYAHIQNELTYQSVAPVKLTYQVKDAKQNYDGKGATLTISDLYNETGHHCDTYTVDVSFLEKRSKDSGDMFYRGFELTSPYTVSKEADKFGRVEMLYAVAEPSTNPRFAEDENIAFQTDENGVNVTWKSYAYDPSRTEDQAAEEKMTNADLLNVVGVRWIYYDLKGFDTTTAYSSTSKTKVALQNVTLTGVGRYQDVTDGTGVKADTYQQYFTATNTYEHIHSEDENAVTVSESGSSVASVTTATEHTVKLTDSTVLNPSVYRENPIASFHTQTFSSESDAAAVYEEKKAQKTSYRPGDTVWQKVTLKNNLAALSSGKQAGEEGRLINPVIYDKVPEYFTKTLYDSYGVGDSIPNFHLRLLNADGSEKDLSNIALYLAAKTESVNGYDYGGKMTYTDGYTNGNASRKAFADLKPDSDNTFSISFTVYELRLRYADDHDKDFVLQPGEQIEFCYSATIREKDLPMVYTASTYANDVAASTVDGTGLHPAYFPRIGEYYQNGLVHYDSDSLSPNGNLYPMLPGGFSNTWDPNNNDKQIQNSNILMDMDYLMHDIGFSADKNTQVDMWEFLDQTITHIPGSSTTSGNISGQNGVLLDEDSQTAKNMQKVWYNAASGITAAEQLQQLPQTVEYKANNINRDWFRLAMHQRNADHADWETLDAAKDTPVIWSETRLHLQKAWLATSTEFLSEGKNIRYEATGGDCTDDGDLTDPNYPYFGTYSDPYSNNSYRNKVHSITDRSGAVALEYDEDTTVQLQAYNYGDWDLDGVTFLYTFAYGMKPVVDDSGKLDVSQVLAYTNTGDSKSGTFAAIDTANVEAEIIQTPETKNPKYLAPKAMRDAAQNTAITDEADGYYTADQYTPYVVKITVKQPLKKWYGRGSDFGYITRVTLPRQRMQQQFLCRLAMDSCAM